MKALLAALNKAHKAAQKKLAYNFGFIVTSPEYPTAQHAVFTWEEALDWMRCYEGAKVLHRGHVVCANKPEYA